MQSRQDLVKKWAPILEHESAPKIRDNYRKEVTAPQQGLKNIHNTEYVKAKLKENGFELLSKYEGTLVGLASNIYAHSDTASPTLKSTVSDME